MLSLVLVALAASLPFASQEDDSEPRVPRVVVLALEGLGADRVQAGIASGALPHLAALAEEGALHRVSGLPGVEAPAVLTALFTGVSPAENGVTGFVVRVNAPSGPKPFFGHITPTTFDVESAEGLSADERELLRDALACWATPNVAPFVWEHAAAAGVASVALRAPQAFDRPAVPGARVLFGSGYPDARGQLGDWFVYTSDYTEDTVAPNGRATGTAGTVFSMQRYQGRYASRLYGPEDAARKAELGRELDALHVRLSDPSLDYKQSLALIDELRKLENQRDALRHGVWLPLEIEPGSPRPGGLGGLGGPDGADGADVPGGATVRIGDESQYLAVGAWSEPFHPVFPLSNGLAVHALTRVKLLALEPHVRLYVHRLDVDPARAPFWQAASAPASFAAELAAAHGPFETYGWATATMAYKDREIDAATVIESAGYTLERERALWRGALARDDWRLLVGTFSVGAQLGYVLTHLAEPEHPRHAAQEAARTVRFLGREIRADGAIDAAYDALDALVGDARATLREEDVLLVVSPNGIASFRRQVHLNNWLLEHGFLAADLEQPTQTLGYVDWSETRAFALGLGGIYLNLAGREAQGSVQPKDADALLDEISAGLLAARDPATDAPLVSATFRPHELFAGEHLGRMPDLIVGFTPPYRVSWSTTLGGLAVHRPAGDPPALLPFVADNDKPWSGDQHSVDPAAIEGVLLASVPLRAPGVGALDVRALAPTILALLGIEPPEDLDLPPLRR